MNLANANLLGGKGPRGKTAIMEWLATSVGYDCMDRWRTPQLEQLRIEYRYHSPESHRVEFWYENDSRNYLLDGKAIYVPVPDLKMVLLQEDAKRRFYSYEAADDLTALSRLLSIDKSLVRTLIKEIARNGTGSFRNMHFEQEDWGDRGVPDEMTGPYMALYVRADGSRREQSIRTLSGSELDRLLFEFAAALAREYSRSAATVLLFDSGGASFSPGTRAMVAEFLAPQPFQTLMTADIGSLSENPIWQTWSRIELKRNYLGQTIISQD